VVQVIFFAAFRGLDVETLREIAPSIFITQDSLSNAWH
jgi:hypothetical protein